MTQSHTGGREKVLVVQMARFGDFLQTTPLLSALKENGARVSVLVDRGQADMARNNPDVDEVFEVDLAGLFGRAGNPALDIGRKVVRLHEDLGWLTSLRFDRIINLNTSRPAALIGELPKADRRDGPRMSAERDRLVPAPWAAYVMNLMARRRLVRFNLVDLLAGYAGVSARTVNRPRYHIGPEARLSARTLMGTANEGKSVGLQLGSRHTSRQWPPERFARLAAGLIRTRNARIVLLGMESERSLGKAVLDELDRLEGGLSAKAIDLMGRTTIDELAGVLEGLDLLVTTDTGAMHLAAAVGTPILALFMGPAFCHETGPYGAGHTVLQTALPCSPCTEGRAECEGYPCREEIRPEAAISTAEWILDGKTGPPPAKGKLGPRVVLYESELDGFGAIFRPASGEPLDKTEALALAFREAGRGFIRPAYETREQSFEKEWSAYAGGTPGEILAAARQLDGLWPGIASERYLPDADLEPLRRILAGMVRQNAGARARKIFEDFRWTLVRAARRAGGSAGRPGFPATAGRRVIVRAESFLSEKQELV